MMLNDPWGMKSQFDNAMRQQMLMEMQQAKRQLSMGDFLGIGVKPIPMPEDNTNQLLLLLEDGE